MSLEEVKRCKVSLSSSIILSNILQDESCELKSVINTFMEEKYKLICIKEKLLEMKKEVEEEKRRNYKNKKNKTLDIDECFEGKTIRAKL